MVTAEFTITKDQLLGVTHPVQYIGLDWETYEEISEEIGETRPLNVTFEKGILTIMPLSEMHELLKTILHDFIRFAGLAIGVNVVATGSATMRSRKRLIGVDPDLSYYVTKAGSHRISRSVGSEISDAPDIVVEIDISHSSYEKFTIYAEFGVPEFWLFDGDRLHIYLLTDGEYNEVEVSRELPVMKETVLSEFLNRAQREEEQVTLLKGFQDWLQKNK